MIPERYVMCTIPDVPNEQTVHILRTYCFDNTSESIKNEMLSFLSNVFTMTSPNACPLNANIVLSLLVYYVQSV